MKITIFALVALVASFAVGQDAPGMYVDRAGSLVKMERVQSSGMESKGVGKSLLIPGSSPSIVWEYPGTEAPIRVSTRPRFVYRVRPNQTVSERDIVLIRMDQKSDHREMKVAKVGVLFNGNTRTGYDEKKLIATTVTRSGDILEITPAGDLDAGEYFMTAGFSPIGFDFGVGGKQ